MKHIGTDPNAVTAYDDNKLQSNIALLGFKTAVNGSLAKYNLQDQIIDEYEDNSGIDTGNSTNEYLSSGAYFGGSTPTVTHDADDTGTDGNSTWYKWTDTAATGSYEQDAAQDVDFLVVAGGGGGGQSGNTGGGGGAGGLRTSYGSASGGGAAVQSDLSLGSGTTYTITVGAGGAGGGSQVTGSVGGASSITGDDIDNVTTVGGGGGGGYNSGGTLNGGSGGGAGDPNGNALTAGTGTANEGYAGGAHGGVSGTDSTQASGGGGGAAAVGAAGVHGTNGGAGGAGLNISITGASVGYAGGGGGGCHVAAGGASHGGGASGSNSAGTAGTANTGGGGGGGLSGSTASAGGSGIVILRRVTFSSIDDLTLQSTANTASSAATKADLIMLMENAEGTATINTDIKGYVTADGGSNWTEGTLVDEGSWGTNKKILAFHDATVTSGTDLRYKITTHNQSEGSKETKIHATSIGWKA